MGRKKKPRRKKYQRRILDIFVIVFSITISIWFNNLNENRKANNEAEFFLTELKIDLNNDIKILESNLVSFENYKQNIQFLININDSIDDGDIGPRTTFSFGNKHFNTARYDGFVSSGKIGSIADEDLKVKILTYYQKTIPELVDNTEFVKYLTLETLSNFDDNLSMRQNYESSKMMSTNNNLKFNLTAYNTAAQEAIKDLKSIIVEIDKLSE